MQTKTSLRIAGALLAIVALSACQQGYGTGMSPDAQRALVGAGAGAVAAKAFDEDIGTGAVLRQGQPGQPLVIGRGAVVGMGAVVTKSVPPGATVVGNPARPLLRE